MIVHPSRTSAFRTASWRKSRAGMVGGRLPRDRARCADAADDVAVEQEPHSASRGRRAPRRGGAARSRRRPSRARRRSLPRPSDRACRRCDAPAPREQRRRAGSASSRSPSRSCRLGSGWPMLGGYPTGAALPAGQRALASGSAPPGAQLLDGEADALRDVGPGVVRVVPGHDRLRIRRGGAGAWRTGRPPSHRRGGRWR